MAHVQDARSFVRALNKPPRLAEPETFVVQQRGVTDAGQVQRAGLDLLVKFAGILPPEVPRLRRPDEQVEPVEFLPQFNGDLVAHHAAFSRAWKIDGDDRIGFSV
jgi:hypothetical protein